jgi:hypothetical protein
MTNPVGATMANKSKPYWVLYVYDNERWHVEFGDYDRATVKAERDDYRSHYKAKHLTIVAAPADDVNGAIERVLSSLNANPVG